jgi:hypothetical protein
MHRETRRLTSFIAGVAALAVSSAASAAVIDFEALGPLTVSILVPSPYVEDGFKVETTIGVPALDVFLAYGPLDPVLGNRYTGDVALINGICCSNTRLTAQDGGPFSLLSIDLAENAPGVDTPNAVLFTGHKQGGGTVTQTINIDVTPFFPTMQTYALNSDFTNLVAVTWDMGADSLFMQFDNIVVAIPEPASLALWLTALAGLGWLAPRRLRRASLS